jgi:glyceraldehyde-3-phosphate dehydrogenase/erythrose-4-phosphate dehydrogenase
MSTRVVINSSGRIGRQAFTLAIEEPEFEVVPARQGFGPS